MVESIARICVLRPEAEETQTLYLCVAIFQQLLSFAIT
jgi:hypothetical protein